MRGDKTWVVLDTDLELVAKGYRTEAEALDGAEFFCDENKGRYYVAEVTFAVEIGGVTVRGLS